MDSVLSFKFLEFNKRRMMRGAEAASMAIIEGGEEYHLWMSKTDISKNMMIYGRHPELVMAYEKYAEMEGVE